MDLEIEQNKDRNWRTFNPLYNNTILTLFNKKHTRKLDDQRQTRRYNMR